MSESKQQTHGMKWTDGCEREPTAGQHHQMRISHINTNTYIYACTHVCVCLLPFSLQLRDRVDSQCAPSTWTLTAQIIRFEIAFSTVLRQTHSHLRHMHSAHIHAENSVFRRIHDCVQTHANWRYLPLSVYAGVYAVWIFISATQSFDARWCQRQQTNCLCACNTTMNKKCHYVWMRVKKSV